MEKENITTFTGENPVYCYPTAHLRYAKRRIMIDDDTCKYELMLQQMWQYSDGTTKWKWVDSLSESFVDEEPF